MSLSTIYDLRDLRLFTGRELRELLREEGRVWQQQLRWDYSKSIELLMSYLDSRILPGFVAVHRPSGKPHAYSFAVYEREKAIVGDLFTTRQLDAESRPALERLLLRHQLPTLQHTPGVARVESQLLLADESQVSAFTVEGFRSYPRLFMEAELPGRLESAPPDDYPAAHRSQATTGELRIQPWVASLYQPAAELIHRAYVGHGDTSINDQYATVQGCLRFLHNIVRFPGCGTFAPEHSWVVINQRTGALEGVALCTRVEPETAHLPQLCMGPQWKGKGHGRTLLQHCMRQLGRSGYKAVTLTVTEANDPALRLYRSIGFETRHRFYANVWCRS